MPLASVEAQNTNLDLMYGTTRGALAPDSHELALFLGHPLLGGVELSGNGYARATVLPADWDALAANGRKSATVTFADPTGEWQACDYYALYKDDGVTLWQVQSAAEPLQVTGAGDGPQVTFTVFHPPLPTL